MNEEKKKGLLGKRSLTKTLLKEIKYQTKNKINRKKKKRLRKERLNEDENLTLYIK
jgi:hypothetical protein